MASGIGGEEMKEIIYVMLLGVSFVLGWYHGIAGYPTTKWIAAPMFAFFAGTAIRLFWMKP